MRAHFDLGGNENKQNCCIWGTENPHAYIEKPTHPKRVTVWCGFWFRDIIGQFFFKNEQAQAVTVNNDCYRAMLNEFFFTKIEEEYIGNIWFQQDNAMYHTAEAALDVLLPVLEIALSHPQSWSRLGISPGGDVVWTPRSCDLTPLDYYLWGTVKDKRYAIKTATIDALKDNIREVIGEIQLHTIDMLKNWSDRVGYCIIKRGSHLNKIICHYYWEELYFQIRKKFEKKFCTFF